MSKNKVITDLDEKRLEQGLIWLASVREIAHFTGDILIFDYGLSLKSKNKLNAIKPKHKNILLEISSLEEGTHVYLSSEYIFKTNINEIFDLAQNDFIHSKGFLAGPPNRWKLLPKINKYLSFIKSNTSIYDCLIENFGTLCKEYNNFTKDSYEFSKTDICQKYLERKIGKRILLKNKKSL